MMRTVLAMALFIAGASAAFNIVRVEQCEGVAVTGRLMQVRVSDCTQLPCPLRKRTQATIEIDFIPNEPVTNGVSTGAYGTINRVKLPFIGTNGRSACPKISPLQTRQAVGAGNQCALNQGQAYTYSNTFPILAIYPSQNVEVTWELIDRATNKKIVCWTMPTRIL